MAHFEVSCHSKNERYELSVLFYTIFGEIPSAVF